MNSVKQFPIGDESEYTIEIDRVWLDITVDLVQAGSDVAANIGKCADVLADRSMRLEVIEAEFRSWKARKKMSYLASSPKLAEWKCKERYRLEPDYLNFYRALAQVKSDLDWITAFQRALEVKAQAVNAFLRAERGVEMTNRTVKIQPGRKVDSQQRRGNIASVRKV